MDEPEFSDGNCNTLPNGDCIGDDCMHDAKPFPYAKPSKELQDMLNYIDEAMAELVKCIALESEMLKDKVSAVAHERLKLETFDRIMQDKE